MIVIATVSTKGGVGKTTLTANLGALLADLGMRVLLLDADVQPSLSRYYAIRDRAPNGLTAAMKTGSLTADCISTLNLPPSGGAAKYPSLNPAGRLDLVASDAPEGALQDWLYARFDAANRIRLALRNPLVAESYDVVLIDTQGAIGHLQNAAILAADLLITPICPDVLTAREFVSGTLELLERLEAAADMGFSMAQMRAIVYKTEHTSDSRAMAKLIREQFLTFRGRVSVVDTCVPASTIYKRAATSQVPVHWIDPHKAGETMHRLVWELIPSLDGLRTCDIATNDIGEPSESADEVTP